MHEIAPGLWHWTARHPHIGSDVSSYYLRSERVALDPLLPAEGLESFDGAQPEHVVLTNRHHDRDAWRLQEAFGAGVADGVVRWGGEEALAFVPDSLMDDPAETKQGLLDTYRTLLDLDFELLLLAHGAPATADAHHELRAFVGR